MLRLLDIVLGAAFDQDAMRMRCAATAHRILVEGGTKHDIEPAAHGPGTRVEVRDLFYATPARLKFMKSPRAERDQAVDSVERLAMAYPAIAFTVIGDEERVLLRMNAAEPDLAGKGPAETRRVHAQQDPLLVADD